jgi:hypothetical protein
MAINPAWTAIRTLVAVAAEGHAADPIDGLFVQTPYPYDDDLLVSFGGCSFANAPNSGVVWIWSLHNDGTTSVKECLAQIVLAGADTGHFTPVIIRPGPALVYATIDSFNGGAVPTMSGTIRMRRISNISQKA